MASPVALKPHVQLLCPVCRVPLPTECRDTQANSVNWVLNAWSRTHLEEHQ